MSVCVCASGEKLRNMLPQPERCERWHRPAKCVCHPPVGTADVLIGCGAREVCGASGNVPCCGVVGVWCVGEAFFTRCTRVTVGGAWFLPPRKVRRAPDGRCSVRRAAT